MEVSPATSLDLVLNSLEIIPQMVTPSLCEIWNW